MTRPCRVGTAHRDRNWWAVPTLLALVFVDPASAADPPERLLPATAQVYVRWDGVPAHRDQYAQTALGQLVANDLAPLRKELLDLYPKLLRAELTERKLLDGLPPQRLAKIHSA